MFLLFAGPDAGELEKIRELGDSLGVTEHYRWLGPLQGEEKHEAFECSEFLALPLTRTRILWCCWKRWPIGSRS